MPTEEEKKEYQLKVKIYLTDPEGTEFMGIGVLWLLQHIDALGSIRKAAARMQLSYVKAHRMIDDVEKHTGMKLVERRRGGESREGTRLTTTGKNFVAAYDRFQKEIKEQAEDSFRRHRDEFGP